MACLRWSACSAAATRARTWPLLTRSGRPPPTPTPPSRWSASLRPPGRCGAGRPSCAPAATRRAAAAARAGAEAAAAATRVRGARAAARRPPGRPRLWPTAPVCCSPAGPSARAPAACAGRPRCGAGGASKHRPRCVAGWSGWAFCYMGPEGRPLDPEALCVQWLHGHSTLRPGRMTKAGLDLVRGGWLRGRDVQRVLSAAKTLRQTTAVVAGAGAGGRRSPPKRAPPAPLRRPPARLPLLRGCAAAGAAAGRGPRTGRHCLRDIMKREPLFVVNTRRSSSQ
jgi:hypothetical protein